MARVFDILWATYMLLLVLIYVEVIKVEAQVGFLPEDEVEALREIAVQVGKGDWNFNVDPCSSNESSWQTPKSDDWPLYNNTLICNCSYPGDICHVHSIFLKGQDLAGVLPPAIVKLPYLKKLDLTRNYLSGNIPPEWASTKLEYLSVTVNRLTGPIPSYLGNITTLTCLSIENNMFSGTVPSELGNLVKLEILVLSANNLTGSLPRDLVKLTKLKEFRISSNNFTGKIPDFIQSWIQLQTLEIQASGLKGPIPSSISLLNLTTLRISDLDAEGSEFPPLGTMKFIQYLMLSNCNISGSIPGYVAEMDKLKILDLSFNRLGGIIPTNIEALMMLERMYLTSNLLTGPIPVWITRRHVDQEIDVSYNSFTESSLPSTCEETPNLFRSSQGRNKLKPVGCLKNHICSKDKHSLHINCGGKAITIGNIKYEGDDDPGGAAKYVPMKANWEISTTGHFWDVQNFADDYIAKNKSILEMKNSELYTTARLTPHSLTYSIRCLVNGNYSVKLHFAEIVIRDNRSFYSLGRRIFDVYIQEKLELKDFDIEKAAQGVDKVTIKEFKAPVRDGILEIRFHWVGKGTTAAPKRGTYGPLVSAIDVESEFKPLNEGKRKNFIVAGAVLFPLLLILILTLLCILWWKGCFESWKTQEQELRGLDLLTGIFTFKQIKAATDNFDPANKIGEGGFGSVYRGILKEGTIIAVKQLSSKSKQGNREFVNEIGMISGLQHPNLVRLYGCCIEGKELLLVYEYMENNSLAYALFEEGNLNLDWPTRQRICVGIAKGLAFLHEESTLKIVHRDIKTTNVLLDKDLNPKISDFGLAKLDEDENSHISTRVAGTIGYMAPEYALWGYLTFKADVYSFGVVAMEIVAGKCNMKEENFVCLLDRALVLQQKGNVMELVDPRLGTEFDQEEVIRMIKVALLCTNRSPALRPSMSAVVRMLEGQAAVHELVMDPDTLSDDLRSKAVRNKTLKTSLKNTSETASLIHSSNTIWGASSSSTSAKDLNEINLH